MKNEKEPPPPLRPMPRPGEAYWLRKRGTGPYLLPRDGEQIAEMDPAELLDSLADDLIDLREEPDEERA